MSVVHFSCPHLFGFWFWYLPQLLFFFFSDPATTHIYTLSLHDALPIFEPHRHLREGAPNAYVLNGVRPLPFVLDRKSTRLNSSHTVISYAVFCLKKKTSRPRKRRSPRVDYSRWRVR